MLLPLFYILLMGSTIIQNMNAEQAPTDLNNYLAILEEIISGPLSGRNLVIYLDPTLDEDLGHYIPSVPSIRQTPHVIVDLSVNASLWSDQQPLNLLRGSYYIHVVLFKKDPTPFFQLVSMRWNPTYLLLCSFVQGLVYVLDDWKLQSIERVALLAPLISSFKSASPSFEVYTTLPFSKDRSPRHIMFWKLKKTAASLEDIFVDRFPTFEGYEFQLSTWLDDYPFLFESDLTAGRSLLKPSPRRPNHNGDGTGLEMVDAMSLYLNYTYTITSVPPDQMWGVFVNGSWHGMLGTVYRNEKNFTINHLPLTIQRMESFDPSISYWMEGYGMAILSPPPLPKWPGIYYPFKPNVWLCVILTFSLIVISMAVQDRLQPEPFLGGMGETWPYLMRSVVNHSVPNLPKAQWQRVFMGSWLIYCFIVTIAYTANLIAFLTIPVFPKRIQTVRELAESDYRVARQDYGDFIPEALRNSGDQYYRALGEKLDLHQDIDIASGYMLNGTHAYIENFSFNKIFFVQYYQADSYMMREEVFPGSLCWYFHKNTAWKYKFDLGLQRLFQSGLISYWMQVKSDDILGRDFDRRQKMKTKETTNEALVLEQVQGPLFVLLFAWILGSLVFIMEILPRNFKQNQKEQIVRY